MKQTCVLIVEDDKEINKLLQAYLSTEGYRTFCAGNGLEAVNLYTAHPEIELILLDIMLPFQSGDTVLKRIRELSEVPIIMLTAKDTVQTKVDIIRMGADDYITKPFDLDEVLVRMEAVLRRSKGRNGQIVENSMIEFKAMKMDTVRKEVFMKGQPIVLTGKEYSILELLLKNPNKLFSKANLFESVWNELYYSEDNTLKVHISNLRNKLKQYDEEEYIETIWGMGYKLKT